MSPEPPTLHVYDREIDAQERTSLSVLTAHIAPGARVLDLGCGSGAVGRFLARRDGPDAGPVDGLTLSQDEADLAAPSYRHLEVADLDQARLTELFPPDSYDAIVCADVLEHTRHPDRVLQQCRELLATGGRVLLSIPNAGYAGLVAELMAGEFRYRPEGLLDETHLRFFTRRSLLRFLAEQRWHMEQVETIRRELPESEFRVAFDALPPAVARHLLALPDALSYQFIITARPAGDDEDISIPQPDPALPAEALFSAQLYWDVGQGFSETSKLVSTGAMGAGRQTLRFRLPPLQGLHRLRLDPADRPGMLHLYRLALYQAGHAQPAWDWSPDSPDALAQLQSAAGHQLAWSHPTAGQPSVLGLLAGDDPWFVLPIESGLLSGLAGHEALELEVELGWPMSADYLSMAAITGPLLAQQHDFRIQIKALQGLTWEHEALKRHLKQAERDRRRLHDECEKTRAELIGMGEHVDNLMNLRAVRASQALRRWLGRAPLDSSRPAARDGKKTLDMTSSILDGRHTERSAADSDTVDIIVPVYRGFEDTQRCIESVLASPAQTPWRLIVINDFSPEPELTSWLRDKASAEPRITLLENTENLGFVGTVNRGMQISDSNDILLLNSDTEVHNDWLDRLRHTAYAWPDIGTVTPFSNNATICSYPSFCEPSPAPQSQAAARLDRLFARANPGQAVEVPTGVGFCMYIRRACLSQVGLFDQDAFGKGYGEENDFCQRAMHQGWRNLHALDTYVLHTGGISFGESKALREIAAVETLNRLHPGYELQVQTYIGQDPARSARLAVQWLHATDEDRKPVVLAVHHNRGGGTERHVLELARTLGESITFVSLKSLGASRVLLQLITPADPAGTQGSDSWQFSQDWAAIFDLHSDLQRFLDLLRTLPVAHIHYHHLLGHGKLVWELPQLLNVGYDFTAHDYYSFCTNITLTGRQGQYQVDEQGQCCGNEHPRSQPEVVEDIERWRIRNRVFLERARNILAPSLDTADRLLRFVPSAGLRHAPHTDLQHHTLPQPAPRPLQADQPLRVAIIGALSIIKGADIVEATAQLARKSAAPLEFHLIGYGYRHLASHPQTRLHVHGQYAEEDLPHLLQQIAPDLVWFPALWPETYSYTLSAALQAGLPVVATDLGAFAERMAERPWSWLQPWNSSAQEWLELFLDIRQQHFIERQGHRAPALPGRLQELSARLGPWSYASDYPPSPMPVPSSDTRLQDMARTLAAAEKPRKEPPLASGRLHALALRLQRQPLLGPIVRRVPRSWRYRVKQLLTH